MLLSKNECMKIKKIKSWVVEMIQERALRQIQDNKVLPSEYWSNFCNYFGYMLGLSEEYYGQLRLHTYHLDGDNYQSFYFGDVRYYRMATSYDKLVSVIPSKYRLSAPKILGEFGYDLGGCTVNNTIVRLQRTINTLYLEGVLPNLEATKERQFLLEVGGGYGCLAYQLKRILDNTTYFVVDLPETLLFSASYLSLALPDKRIYLYDSSFPKLLSAELSDYDFILLPNYALSYLTGIKFDLALNIASFQEMTRDQLIEYLDFIRAHSRLLYSMNQPVQDKNPDHINVTDALKERFSMKRIPAPFILRESRRWWIRFAAYLLGLRERLQNEYKEYVCTPK